MISFTHATKLSDNPPAENDYVIFGGTFDPFHEGHVSVVKALWPHFSRIIIACTEQNPWKKDSPAAFSLRREMVRIILSAEGIPLSKDPSLPGTYVSATGYIYAEELVNHYRKQLAGNLHWAVGEDSAESVKDWKNWDSLKVPMIVAPIEIDTHATPVRAGDKAIHPAIAEFVAKHGLYQR